MKQVEWNKLLYEEFKSLAFLSDFQLQVMDLHVRRVSDVEISMKLHCSESSVQRAIRECKDKYDAVQPYSDILPVRKKSKTEK